MPTMDFEAAIERNLNHIRTSPTVHPDNKEQILTFHRHLQLSGISPAYRQKVTAHLKIVALHLEQTRFVDLRKEGMVELVAWLYTRGTSESTVSDYKQIIKQFWKWMNDGTNPVETEWIRHQPTAPTRLLPQSLLTPRDVQALIAACSNLRDEALVAMLWETGARIGELIDLRVGEIEPGPAGRHVVVSGKTGSRRLLLIESEPYIEAWLAAHPNPRYDAPLWCRIDFVQGSPDEQISYQYIRLQILKKARRRTGLEKPVNPHHFRHSRATHLANYLTEAQLCEWFGWARGSRVPGRYIHLSGRDIDRAYHSILRLPEYERLAPSLHDEDTDSAEDSSTVLPQPGK